mgnify:CR=1 FL=1
MSSTTFDPRSPQRFVLFQPGGFASRHGKTGLSLLRYRGSEAVAVVDHENAGRSLREISGLPHVPDLRVVGTVAEALASRPTALAIGIAPSGGRLPDEWRVELREAVKAGVSIWNGLHTPLNDDPVIASTLRPGVVVWDMRREPPALKTGTGGARQLPCRRILFVGTDMSIGKMTAALEFDRESRRRGLRSAFVGTGQAGMMISGAGLCLDAVRVDYASGSVEAEVMRQGKDCDVVWVEGQGSLLNPASTATLPLLRGSQPTHLVLVHKAGLTHLQAFPHLKIPPLEKVVELYEQMSSAGGIFPSVSVVGIALNTWGMSEEAARRAVDLAAEETGLPTTDAVRFGTGEILDAIMRTPGPGHSSSAVSQ